MKKIMILLAAGGAFALAAAGCGNTSQAAQPKPTASTAADPAPPPSSSVHAVAVTLSEWSIKSDAAKVAAGRTTFTVTNTGKLPHEMVVLRTSKDAAALGSGSRIGESGHVGEVEDVRPGGGTKTLTLTLKPGHYSLVCNLPGHYMAGMRTDLTVG
jgi:uncharacterized cupredoxin-like copper-binding protein